VSKLYVIRHADAGPRGQLGGRDDERPLSERGWRQAAGLRDRLADAGIERLVTSPYVRCRETLEPLATQLGLEIEADDRLAEGMGFSGALALAGELATTTAAICSHGDVIPDLLDALLRRGIRLKDELRWQKGSAWVLVRSGEGFSKGHYLPPTA
jgi:8-oxo-dGTP diphosphatase